MNNKKKKNMLPALAMAGPVSVWMILFVTIPMLYIIYISFYLFLQYNFLNKLTTLCNYVILPILNILQEGVHSYL